MRLLLLIATVCLAMRQLSAFSLPAVHLGHSVVPPPLSRSFRPTALEARALHLQQPRGPSFFRSRPSAPSHAVSVSPSSSSLSLRSPSSSRLHASATSPALPSPLLSLEETKAEKLATLVMRASTMAVFAVIYLILARVQKRKDRLEQERVLREVEKFKKWNEDYLKGTEEEKRKKEEGVGTMSDVDKAKALRKQLWRMPPKDIEGVVRMVRDKTPDRQVDVQRLKRALSRDFIDVTPGAPEAPNEIRKLIQELAIK